ncbi:PAS domain S-box protein [Mucilaginibacter terrenus]|uniref:PAS domain S-box protein n=1 Tax=Mucilaginibacter terrenus TaxID=2482727 RepID=A0A3E2NLN9_9SPHI|nr:PAS domain S-box protein [Mucilaginibacter terrenus]RFZ81820.1 PAS domain S-box protein [Mucilaginibacter terrenus]
MKIPFTPQLLGDLIEKGYTHVLVSTSTESSTGEEIVLKPVRQKPDLDNLPDGYEIFYAITREPMMMVCGIDGTTISIEYETLNNDITSEDIFNDSYFRMSEDFFKQVLESLEDYAVFTTDKNGDVNSWNSGAEKVLGYTEVEIIGAPASVFFTTEDQIKQAHERELETALKEGRAIDERYHVRKDGSKFWGSGLVFPLYDEEQQHRGFTKVMRNLREREEAEQQAGRQSL